jgi:hypothetical protein
MQAYETSATVQGAGEIRVAGVPFEPGTEVEVSISPRRKPAEDFAAAWERVCRQMRATPTLQNITDDEIRAEIDAHRAGQ